MGVDVLHRYDAIPIVQHHWDFLRDVAGFAPSEQSDAKADEQRTDYCQNRHPSITDISLVVGHTISI